MAALSLSLTATICLRVVWRICHDVSSRRLRIVRPSLSFCEELLFRSTSAGCSWLLEAVNQTYFGAAIVKLIQTRGWRKKVFVGKLHLLPPMKRFLRRLRTLASPFPVSLCFFHPEMSRNSIIMQQKPQHMLVMKLTPPLSSFSHRISSSSDPDVCSGASANATLMLSLWCWVMTFPHGICNMENDTITIYLLVP